MRFGISFDGGDSPELLRAMVRDGRCGRRRQRLDRVAPFYREPIACAALTLAKSRHIGIVLMAMSPYTVHPVYATMAAATLDEFFPGRVQLCFGAGAPRDLEAAGLVADHPLETLRESIAIARALLAGETSLSRGSRLRVWPQARHGRAAGAALARCLRTADAGARRRARPTAC